MHGFSQAALSLGARDAGFLDISTNLLPHGVFSLVQWHLVSQREALAGKAEKLFAEAGPAGQWMGLGKMVEMLTWERLMGNKEIIGRWQEVRITNPTKHTSKIGKAGEKEKETGSVQALTSKRRRRIMSTGYLDHCHLDIVAPVIVGW